MVTTDSVRDQVFEAIAQIPGFDPYEVQHNPTVEFLLDAGDPDGPIEDRGLFVVLIEKYEGPRPPIDG